jgi:hypothetical protein
LKILYTFGYLLEHCTEIFAIFLNSGQVMVIENLKKHLILALDLSTCNFFNFSFWPAKLKSCGAHHINR